MDHHQGRGGDDLVVAAMSQKLRILEHRIRAMERRVEVLERRERARELKDYSAAKNPRGGKKMSEIQ